VPGLPLFGFVFLRLFHFDVSIRFALFALLLKHAVAFDRFKNANVEPLMVTDRRYFLFHTFIKRASSGSIRP
jgi:hypothetical protein